MKITSSYIVSFITLISTTDAVCCSFGWGHGGCSLPVAERYYAIEGYVPEEAVHVEARRDLEAEAACCCFAPSRKGCMLDC